MNTDILQLLKTHWGWTGAAPAELIAQNAFGNLIVTHDDGSVWRLCPEDLWYAQIATSLHELDSLMTNHDFQEDWQMAPLVQMALKKLGPAPEGSCYALITPPLFGGSYGAENMCLLPLHEVIGVSGDFACQTKDIPEGGKIRIKIVDGTPSLWSRLKRKLNWS